MAAALAQGHTIIENAAREPEIIDLAHLLRAMGAKIKGEGTSTIHVEGVTSLGAARHPIIADRIEAGTYIAAVGITGGRIRLPGVAASLMQSTLDLFQSAGLKIKANEMGIEAWREGDTPLKAVDVTTKEFPSFPTDMQAQFMAAMCFSEGTSTITENIFENRFMHVPELCRLGADITIQGNSAVVKGRGLSSLSGATTMATDLRASASLVLAGMGARGETSVRRVYHLDRGYEKMEHKLTALGAKIRREKE
jgi:UDP-N-acetylglucosamine 1-carboxyvinyltransferase